jgi:cell division transport system permease protein
VIVITPVTKNRTPQSVSELLNELSTQKEVELAQIDMEWVARLHAMMAIGERTVWVLATLLSLAVLLVIGNTVRLAIQNRRDEIIITKLIGATDAFIQRPFLYTGFWYGAIGGFIAIVLIESSLLLIETPFKTLTALYNSQFLLAGMGFSSMLSLIIIGSVLGLFGSWIAVGQHLKDIEPS